MAQHVNVIMNNLHAFIDTKLTAISQNTPLMALAKPIVKRMLDNNLYKVESLLKQVSNKDGLIDIDEIISEMSDGIMNTHPFKIDTGVLGELEIGDGKIKMDIPLVNKSLILTQQDIAELKEMLSH